MNTGDIVVVTERYRGNYSSKGDIARLEKIDNSDNTYCVSSKHLDESWCKTVRLANSLEIKFYYLGIRNIKDIKNPQIIQIY